MFLPFPVANKITTYGYAYIARQPSVLGKDAYFFGGFDEPKKEYALSGKMEEADSIDVDGRRNSDEKRVIDWQYFSPEQTYTIVSCTKTALKHRPFVWQAVVVEWYNKPNGLTGLPNKYGHAFVPTIIQVVCVKKPVTFRAQWRQHFPEKY